MNQHSARNLVVEQWLADQLTSEQVVIAMETGNTVGAIVKSGLGTLSSGAI